MSFFKTIIDNILKAIARFMCHKCISLIPLGTEGKQDK